MRPFTRRAATLFAALLTAIGMTAAVAAPAQAAVASKLTYKVRYLSPSQTTKDWVKGTVYPSSRARNVYLQKKTRSGWVNVVRTSTYKGAYTLPISTKNIGSTAYRVYVPAGSGGAKAASPSFTVKVRQWIVKEYRPGGLYDPIIKTHTCKTLSKSSWYLDFTVYFTNGASLRFKMTMYGSPYINQIFGVVYVDLNYAFVKECRL